MMEALAAMRDAFDSAVPAVAGMTHGLSPTLSPRPSALAGRDYDPPRCELALDQSFAVTRNPMALRDRQS
jgi:hypothetical protein